MVPFWEVKANELVHHMNGARPEQGAMLVEYALLFALVVIAAVIGLVAFGVAVFDLYTFSSETYAGAVSATVG